MIARLRNSRAIALVVVVGLVATAVLLATTGDSQRRVTAYFASGSAVYAGNPVEVLGVPVGSVASITPEPGRVKVVLELDRDVKLPREVQAAQVSPSLISGRKIALTPRYDGGPVLADGAEIPEERTQVPLDVNDLYRSARDLSQALGPRGANKDGSLSRALDVLAGNLEGNGDSLARAISGLAGASGVLAGSRKDLTGTVRGLQTFVTTLAENDGDVRGLNQKLATVSNFLAEDRDELGAALRQLSISLGEVAQFVKENRDLVRSNVTKLTKATKVLVRKREKLAAIVDEAPTGLGNLLNAYDAAGSTLDVRIDVNELDMAPGALVCELVARSTPDELPDSLTSLCSGLIGQVGAGAPTLAELLGALQGGRTTTGGGAR